MKGRETTMEKTKKTTFTGAARTLVAAAMAAVLALGMAPAAAFASVTAAGSELAAQGSSKAKITKEEGLTTFTFADGTSPVCHIEPVGGPGVLKMPIADRIKKGGKWVKPSFDLKWHCTETYKNLKWTSSNKKVLTVNSKGRVTAQRPGKAKITATCYVNGHKISLSTNTLTVYNHNKTKQNLKANMDGYTVKVSKKQLNKTGKVTVKLGKLVTGNSGKLSYKLTDKAVLSGDNHVQFNSKKNTLTVYKDSYFQTCYETTYTFKACIVEFKATAAETSKYLETSKAVRFWVILK